MVRERGLAYSKMGEQLACAELSLLGEKLDDMQARGVGERLEAPCRELPRELDASVQAACLYAFLEVEGSLDNHVGGGEKRLVPVAGGVLEPPVFPMPRGKRGAADAAAHGDENVDAGQLAERLGLLGRGIYAKTVSKHAKGVGVDALRRVRSCRAGGQRVSRPGACNGFCDLAAARVVRADKGDNGKAARGADGA